MHQKIYITCLHLNHGGVEMAISLLSNALRKRGYDVEILCTYNFGIPAYYIDPDVTITYLTDVLPNRQEFKTALHKRQPFRILKEGLSAIRVLYLKKYCLKKALIKLEKGIVISTRHEDSILLSKYGNKNLLKIAQLHHDHHFNPGLIKDFQKKYTNIDYFVLLTDVLRNEVREFMAPYNTKTKCVTIPNFLTFDDKNHIAKKQKQVISVGRLHSDKGFHRLIDVWALVHKTHPDWILKIVGNGPLKEELQNQIHHLGLEQAVILTGALDHDSVMEEMAHSSVYAMTSISEAFPFVLLEAMYNYLPVVAYDVRVGPRALVLDKETGYLVPDNDAHAFSQSLYHLMDNPEIMTQFQNNAKLFVQNFSENKVMESWLSIISDNPDTP